MGIRFFGHNSYIFLSNWAEILYGNSGVYYLSIDGEK